MSLPSVREAVRVGSKARFLYEGIMIEAELYLLGQARKTGAFIVLAWCTQPSFGWMQIRFALMRDFEVTGRIERIRADYDPRSSCILTIDTRLPASTDSHH